MPIFSLDPVRQVGETVDPESTRLELLRESAEDVARSGPIGAGYRALELWNEEGYGLITPFGTVAPRTSRHLTPEDARTRLADAGLSESLPVPESGIREGVLDILIERKLNEQKRDSIYASAPDGVWVPQLAGALAGSLADPFNIAAAFIPVVGEARYAALLSRAGGIMGRTGTRIGVGAVEGLVGAALVEPLNYYANRQQFADYDAYDAMLNIAGGAVFGAALHAGAGLLGDAMAPGKWNQAPPPRQVVDTATGTVDPLVTTPAARQFEALTPEQRERMIVMDRLAEGRPVTTAQAKAMGRTDTPEFQNWFQGSKVVGADGAPMRVFHGTRRQFDEFQLGDAPGFGRGIYLTDSRDAAAEYGGGAGGRIVEAYVSLKNPYTGGGIRLDLLESTNAWKNYGGRYTDSLDAWQEDSGFVGDVLRELGYDGVVARNSNDIDGLEIVAFDPGQVRIADDMDFVESLSTATRRALDTDPLMSVRPFIAGLQPQTQAAALRMAVAQAADGRPIDVMPAIFTDGGVNAPDLAMQSAAANAKLMDAADEAAARQVDEAVPDEGDVEELKAMFADESRLVDRLYAAAGREADTADIRRIDDMMQRDKKAVDSATTCLLGGQT